MPEYVLFTDIYHIRKGLEWAQLNHSFAMNLSTMIDKLLTPVYSCVAVRRR